MICDLIHQDSGGCCSRAMALQKLGRFSRSLSQIFRGKPTTISPKLQHFDTEVGFTILVAVSKTCSQVWLGLFLAAESLRQQVPTQAQTLALFLLRRWALKGTPTA